MRKVERELCGLSVRADSPAVWETQPSAIPGASRPLFKGFLRSVVQLHTALTVESHLPVCGPAWTPQGIEGAAIDDFSSVCSDPFRKSVVFLSWACPYFKTLYKSL